MINSLIKSLVEALLGKNLQKMIGRNNSLTMLTFMVSVITLYYVYGDHKELERIKTVFYWKFHVNVDATDGPEQPPKPEDVKMNRDVAWQRDDVKATKD